MTPRYPSAASPACAHRRPSCVLPAPVAPARTVRVPGSKPPPRCRSSSSIPKPCRTVLMLILRQWTESSVLAVDGGRWTVTEDKEGGSVSFVVRRRPILSSSSLSTVHRPPSTAICPPSTARTLLSVHSGARLQVGGVED